jgi:hypothetical protein
MTDLDTVKAALEKAHTEVGEICRRTGAGRWRMSIPARPDRDSDLIIADALRHADALLAEVSRLRSALEEIKLRTVQRDLNQIAKAALQGGAE